MASVLFLCSGNVGRSAFAERYAQLRAQQLGRDLTFESAGLEAIPGAGMEPGLAEELRTRGGSPGGFRARQIDPEDRPIPYYKQTWGPAEADHVPGSRGWHEVTLKR